MAAWIPLVLALFQAPAAGDGLLVRLVTGSIDEQGLSAEALGLGDGGLRARKHWRKQPEGRRGLLTTRGGAVLRYGRQGVDVSLPNGARLGIDARARLVGESGPLTRPALSGLALRLADGSELRVWPGSERHGVRGIAFVDRGVEHPLVRRGRRTRGRSKATAFYGPRYYLLGAGDLVVSLVAFGPVVFVHPVAARGRTQEPCLVIAGDLVREASARLREVTPRQSAQYPLAYEQARFLEAVCRRLLPAEKASRRELRSIAGVGLTVALGPEVRLKLAGSGPEPLRSIALGVHLAPEAEASLEFVSGPGSCRVFRVLPESQQKRSRYLGGGVALGSWIGERLPWRLPLASHAQRRQAIASLAPFLVSQVPVKATRVDRR